MSGLGRAASLLARVLTDWCRYKIQGASLLGEREGWSRWRTGRSGGATSGRWRR